MIKENLDDFYYLLKKAYQEDLLDIGDLTSYAIFDQDHKSNAILIAKEDSILFGIEYFKLCFLYLDKDFVFNQFKNDKDKIIKGDVIIEIKGKTRSILEAERVSLNFLSFLSGISTKANKLSTLAGSIIILDTRKTLPVYRRISKEAVAAGGAQNHRMGLYDMIMIKDNHIDASGSISNAIKMVKYKYQNKYKIEVECRNEKEVKEAIEGKVDIVMLDNIDKFESERIIRKYRGMVKFECSGDMNYEKILEHKDVKPDYISVGSLTHSVVGINFSLKIKPS